MTEMFQWTKYLSKKTDWVAMAQ